MQSQFDKVLHVISYSTLPKLPVSVTAQNQRSVRMLHLNIPTDMEDEYWMTKVKDGKMECCWTLPWEPSLHLPWRHQYLNPASARFVLDLSNCVFIFISVFIPIFWWEICRYTYCVLNSESSVSWNTLKKQANRCLKLKDPLCASASSFMAFSHFSQPQIPSKMWKLVNKCKGLGCHSEECLHSKHCTVYTQCWLAALKWPFPIFCME